MPTLKSSRRRQPARNTRARVLECARALFNTHGPQRVTTAMIAEAAGINEGNLYYHFERKEQLVVALTEAWMAEYQACMDRQFSVEDSKEVYTEHLRDWFALIWKYHFLYRDLPAVSALAPRALELLRHGTALGQRHVGHVLETMAAHGVLAVEGALLERLTTNVYVVCAHWLGFLRAAHGCEALTEEMIMEGVAQVSALTHPYWRAPMPVAAIRAFESGKATTPTVRRRKLAEAAD